MIEREKFDEMKALIGDGFGESVYPNHTKDIDIIINTKDSIINLR